jgi:hypothetical protein
MAIRIIGIVLLVIGGTFCVLRLVGYAPNAFVAIGTSQIAIGTSLVAIGLNSRRNNANPSHARPDR